MGRLCLLCGFCRLAENLWKKHKDPSGWVDHVDKAIKASGKGSIVYPWTRNFQQADAHEFVLFLVDTFLVDFNYP